MIIDGHIHINNADYDQSLFMTRLSEAGIDGGIILSLSPDSFRPWSAKISPEERINNVMTLCRDQTALYPFFWIDPLADDADDQIDTAINAGIKGFKVICDLFYPENPKAMKTFKAIAERNRPILFHSGILWDGKPSSKYNQPVHFEPLLEIKNLRFSLAHISWPWVDELIAVYGKFQNSYKLNPDTSCEMFIDTTPGTPEIYRRDALVKLFTVGYDIENNIFFGTDELVENYNVTWTKNWIDIDKKIMNSLSLSEEIIDKVFADNVKRFLNQ